jgi:hypothetical protein
MHRSRGSSVSIVSGYGLDDRAIDVRSPAEVRGFFLSLLCPHRLWGPPSLLYNGYRGVLFLGVKRGRDVTLTTHPIKCRGRKWVGAIPPLPLRLHRCVVGLLYFLHVVKSPPPSAALGLVTCSKSELFLKTLITSWNTRRCPGLKIKWKKSSDKLIIGYGVKELNSYVAYVCRRVLNGRYVSRGQCNDTE